jgi:low temperature requirement protein LtrA
MTSSLSADFDPYYLSFLIGYIGLRAVTAIQYLIVQRIEAGVRKQGALFLGRYFWIGIVISLLSVFFDSWIRYAVLYFRNSYRYYPTAWKKVFRKGSD